MDQGWHTLALDSQVWPAHLSDVETLMPLLRQTRQHVAGIWPLSVVLADKGYIQGQQSGWLRQNWHMALVLSPKKDMTPPQGCQADGCPTCPAGERLVWEDYLPEDGGVLIYRGDPAVCRCCALRGDCPRQFERQAAEHETYFGMVPSHSRLCRRLLRLFRPRIEPGFNISKNIHGLKNCFVNSHQLAQTLCAMSDVLETLSLLARQRPCAARKTDIALKGDLREPEFWD